MPSRSRAKKVISERVLGVPAKGHSRTTTDVTIRLIPDPHRLRFTMRATGEVSMRATSRSGPANVAQ